MTDPIAERMSSASAIQEWTPPKKGDRFRCEQCGMEIQVKTDCRCQDWHHTHFECCGQEMARI